MVQESCLAKYLSRNPGHEIIDSTFHEILSHGADIDGHYDGRTTLSRYALKGDLGNMETLLRFGASIFKLDGSIPSAFIAATREKHNLDMIKFLYARASDIAGFEINALDRFAPCQTGAIHEAAYSGSPEILEFLIERGADPNLRSGELGLTPIMMAYSDIATNVLKILIARGADINSRDSNGRSVFFIFCQVGFEQGCALLMQLGADITSPDNNGVTPLDIVRFICQHLHRSPAGNQLRVFPHAVPGSDGRSHWAEPKSYEGIRDRLERILGTKLSPMRMSPLEFAEKYRLKSIVDWLKN